jgi:RNA polymerase sigma-70 factor (ECF subfamily)
VKETAITDQQILQLVQAGHKEAYGDLIRQYHKKVMGYCLSMLNNHTEAEEAAQDIFVKAYQSLDKFKGNSSFSTWLYRITTNHCLDILRKRNRRKTVSLDALVEQSGDRINGMFASDENAAAGVENRQMAHKILSTLPEDYRAILTLREAQGLEYQEIADTLECSLDAVKGRLARARKQLQENLKTFLNPKGVYMDRKEFLRPTTKLNKNFSRSTTAPSPRKKGCWWKSTSPLVPSVAKPSANGKIFPACSSPSRCSPKPTRTGWFPRSWPASNPFRPRPRLPFGNPNSNGSSPSWARPWPRLGFSSSFFPTLPTCSNRP